MAYEITNLYQELGIPTSETKTDAILAAIDAQIKSWQQRVNNPKYKLEAPAHTAALKKLRTEVQANPAIIKQHAAAYAEIEKRERIQKEKMIREIGNLYVQNGEIPRENLTQLVNKTKLSEQEILSILGAKVKEARKKLNFDYEDDGVAELDRVTMGKIETNLKPLAGPKNLYEFLGVKQNSGTQELSTRLSAITKQVSEDPHKTDPVVSAKKALCDLCRDILTNPGKRKSYDKALANLSFAPIAEMIRNFKAGSPFMTSQVLKKLIDEATKQGIPLEKAKFLIYQTADSIGLPIAADDVTDNMVQCRFCGALNEKGAANCRSCGMPIVVVCPNCGKPSKGDDLACTQCGFGFSDMMRAPEYVKLIESAITSQDYYSALDGIKKLETVWKTHPQLALLKRKCNEVQQQAENNIESVKDLCKKKLYYKARAAVASMGSSPQIAQVRAEIDSAIDLAEKQILSVSQIQDTNARIDKYMQVLSICADCEKAKVAIESNPPTAPTAFVSEINGSSIRIKWNKLNSQYIEYRIIRKEGGRPTSIKDGTHLADTSNAQYDDTSVTPGVSYFYAVFSKCGEIVSKTGLVSDKPSLVVCGIDMKTLSYDIQEKSIGFNMALPKNAKAIEIYRDGTLVKTIYGSSYVDSGLIPEQEYHYKFVVIFEDSTASIHKSNGVSLKLKPMAPPKPVSLKIEDSEKEARLSWTLPGKGTLSIFVSETPLPYHTNDIVNLDVIKLPKLSITGTNCTISKDFSGERYYLPLSIQGNIAVVGDIVRLVSIVKPSDVRFDRNEGFVMVKWNWNNTSAVRLEINADNANPQFVDLDSQKSAPQYKVDLPRNAKSIRIAVHSMVKSGTGEVLLSDGVESVINLSLARVTFSSVKKCLFGDKYKLELSSDSILPGSLSLLIAENFPPNDLVNIKSYLTISPSEIKPGVSVTKEFHYTRRMKGKPVYFRLITTDRAVAKQVSIVPETRNIK